MWQRKREINNSSTKYHSLQNKAKLLIIYNCHICTHPVLNICILVLHVKWHKRSYLYSSAVPTKNTMSDIKDKTNTRRDLPYYCSDVEGDMFYSFVGTHIWPNIQVNKLFIIIFLILNNQDELGCCLGTEEECLLGCGLVYGEWGIVKKEWE